MKSKKELEINSKIIQTYYVDDDYEKANTSFLALIKKSNHHPEVIRTYLYFCYPLRNYNLKATKYCISLCEELIANKDTVLEPYDYLKLGSLYDEIEDYDNGVKCFLEAEKHIEKKGYNKYADIAWYYDEIAEDYPKAIAYYKKYLEHNRVWFCDNKNIVINLIKELEEKIKSQNG